MNNSKIGLNYEPFVGIDYEHGIYEKKVIILGYYIYGTKPEDKDKDAIKKRVKISLQNNIEKENWINNYRNFIKTLSEDDYPYNYGEKIWNKVLFHTYIQEPLKEKKSKPRVFQIRNAQESLKFVIKEYQPDVILVWTKGLSDKLKQFLNYECSCLFKENESYIIKMEGKVIRVLVIDYFPYRFSPSTWRPIIHEFLNITN